MVAETWTASVDTGSATNAAKSNVTAHNLVMMTFTETICQPMESVLLRPHLGDRNREEGKDLDLHHLNGSLIGLDGMTVEGMTAREEIDIIN